MCVGWLRARALNPLRRHVFGIVHISTDAHLFEDSHSHPQRPKRCQPARECHILRRSCARRASSWPAFSVMRVLRFVLSWSASAVTLGAGTSAFLRDEVICSKVLFKRPVKLDGTLAVKMRRDAWFFFSQPHTEPTGRLNAVRMRPYSRSVEDDKYCVTAGMTFLWCRQKATGSAVCSPQSTRSSGIGSRIHSTTSHVQRARTRKLCGIRWCGE